MSQQHNHPSSFFDPLPERTLTLKQGLILLLCMIASMIEGFDIVVIAYTAPAITEDLKLTADQLGLVFSAGVLGMTLGAMLLSSLADIYGRKIVVGSALFLAGIATYAIIYSGRAIELIALRTIAGFTLGALVATLPALVGEYSPSRYRTLFISVMIASANFGGFAGGLLVADVIADIGWRQVFVYAGIFTGIVAIFILWFIPETPAFLMKTTHTDALSRTNRSLKFIGQATLSELPKQQLSGIEDKASVAALLRPERRSTTLLVWTAFFLALLVTYFISSWIPQILSSAGLGQQQAIQGATALPLGAIVGNILIGWLTTRLPIGKLISGAFILGAILMFSLGAIQSSISTTPFYFVWLLLFATGISLLGAFGNLYNVAMIVYPPQIRATGLGWAAGLGRAGAVASPMLAGLLLAQGLSLPLLFVIFAIPALLAAVSVRALKIKEMA